MDSERCKMTYEEELEIYVRDYLVFIDTCSLLETSASNFWNEIIPFLSQYQKKIILPRRCGDELVKHQKNTENTALASRARQVVKDINVMIKAGYVQLFGDNTDNFADNVFLTIFSQKRINNKLLLITQDNALAQDLLNLNKSKSVKGFPIVVKRLNRAGKLDNFIWQQNSSSETGTVPQNSIPDSQQNSFRVCKSVTSIPDSPININNVPQERDNVYTESGKSIRLLSKVGSGGEGTIYSTDTQYVAKIYLNGKNTKRKKAKIDLLLSKHPQFDGICFPVEKLYNNRNEYVGFLMPQAKGKELQKSIFIKPLFQKNFPNWKKRDTVELCITILNKIKYLHEKNIIMGDINPLNILVVSPKEVYFVDTDSYQIEDFPCPVGTINYTAPEIQGKEYAKFLRTIGNENFAVATLLFMIMLPGKPPYSQQGGADQAENIKKMDFSYPLGDISNKKTPEGPWRYIWSHLTYKLKDAFYNTFAKNGKNANESSRLSVTQWLPIFEEYLDLLDSGKFAKQDEMSVELFPTRFKKNKNMNYTRCIVCGNEVTEDSCQNRVCFECQKKGEVLHCQDCGEEFVYTNRQKYVLNEPRPRLCPECQRNPIVYRDTCIDCGDDFYLREGEYNFYENKGLDLPKRCKSCRELKKQSSNSTTSSSGSSWGSSPFPFPFPSPRPHPSSSSSPIPSPRPNPSSSPSPIPSSSSSGNQSSCGKNCCLYIIVAAIILAVIIRIWLWIVF